MAGGDRESREVAELRNPRPVGVRSPVMRASFRTPSGVEIPAVTAAGMREIDRVAIEETGPNLFQMMENAGRALATVVLDALDGGDDRVVVLAGTGGNGGGGICAARHLANRGVRVVVAITDPARLAGVPAAQLSVYRAAGGAETVPDDLGRIRPGIVVDALVGYGLSGPPEGEVARLVRWAGTAGGRVIALDVPTGMDATTGEVPGVHVRARVTVTLDLPKTGLDAPAAGEVLLADIGIPDETHRRAGIEVPPARFGAGWIVPLG